MNQSTIVDSNKNTKRKIAKVCACECRGIENELDKGMQIEIPAAGEYNQMNDKMDVLGKLEVETGSHVEIKEAGKTVARIDCKTKQPLITKELDEEQSFRAIKKYMKEHGLKTMDEVIASSETKADNQVEQDEAR